MFPFEVKVCDRVPEEVQESCGMLCVGQFLSGLVCCYTEHGSVCQDSLHMQSMAAFVRIVCHYTEHGSVHRTRQRLSGYSVNTSASHGADRCFQLSPQCWWLSVAARPARA